MNKLFASILAIGMALSFSAYGGNIEPNLGPSHDENNRWVKIHNLSKKRIVALYASPIDQKDYRYNMIRSPKNWIRSGQVMKADIDDGTGYCMYDLRAERADGKFYEKLNVNVCVVEEWFLNP